MTYEQPFDLPSLLERLKALSKKLHAQEEEGHKNVWWHPDGFTVDDAIEVIKGVQNDTR